MHTSNGNSPILVLALACFFQAAWAKNFDRMVLGQVYLEESKETPPRLLVTGDCVEYIFPRSHNGRFGAIEACMKDNCNFEIRERDIIIPHYESNTTGQGSNCFLKLQDKGGLDILDGPQASPNLVKTLVDNTGPKASESVGYEITLEDTYKVKVNYELEYESGRFTKEPTLLIHRIDWRWFTKDHIVHSQLVSTLPLSNISAPHIG